MTDEGMTPRDDRRVNELSALYRLASLVSEGDLDRVVAGVLEVIESSIPCERGLILLWEEDAVVRNA